jgi:hypothetical protein
MKNPKFGIIQSRGLGDIVITLPIADHYRQEGYDVYWPICDQFLPHVKDTVPWVKWIPIPTDTKGDFFYDEPVKRLRNFQVDEYICLYNSLTGHPELRNRPEFQIMKFDQYKYAVTGVPFLNKWRLPELITRDPVREQALWDRLVTNENYVVLHLNGSDHRADFDRSAIPPEWQTIEIESQSTCIFDWLQILEGAQSIVCVDSVFANLVDQMGIDNDLYLIPRSHIQLTPVLGQSWTVLEPSADVVKRTTIFGGG